MAEERKSPPIVPPTTGPIEPIRRRAIETIDRYVPLAVPADVVSDLIDPGAQLSLLRLAWSPDPQRRGAGLQLIAAARTGVIASIDPDEAVHGAVLFRDAPFSIRFESALRWNVPALDEAFYSLAIAHQKELSDSSASRLQAGTDDVNPWLCAAVCAACALAILDGVPGDEVAACLVCANVCSGGGALTETPPIFLKA